MQGSRSWAPPRPESRAAGTWADPEGGRPPSRGGDDAAWSDPYTQDVRRRAQAAYDVAQDVLNATRSPSKTSSRPGGAAAYDSDAGALAAAGASWSAVGVSSSTSHSGTPHDFGAEIYGAGARPPSSLGQHRGSGQSHGGWYERYDAFGREVTDGAAAPHGMAAALYHSNASGSMSSIQQQQSFALDAAVALVQHRQQLRGASPLPPPQWAGAPPGGTTAWGGQQQQHVRDSGDASDWRDEQHREVQAQPARPFAVNSSTRASAASLDDMPVTPGIGAAGKAASFDELLEAELAKQKEGRADRASSTPAARSFLRKGTRAARTPPPGAIPFERPVSRAPAGRQMPTMRGKSSAAEVVAVPVRHAAGETSSVAAKPQSMSATVTASREVAMSTSALSNNNSSASAVSGNTRSERSSAPRPFLRRGQGVMATSVAARQRKEAIAAAVADAAADRVGGIGMDDDAYHARRAPSRASGGIPVSVAVPTRRPPLGAAPLQQQPAAAPVYGYPSDEEVPDTDTDDYGGGYDDDVRESATAASIYPARLSAPTSSAAAAAARYSASSAHAGAAPRSSVTASMTGASMWADEGEPWDDDDVLEDVIEDGFDEDEQHDDEVAEEHELPQQQRGGTPDDGSTACAQRPEARLPRAELQPQPQRRAPAAAPPPAPAVSSDGGVPQATCALVQSLFFDEKAKRSAITAQHMRPTAAKKISGAAVGASSGDDANVATRLAAVETELSRLKEERRRSEEARTGAEAARALLNAERTAFARDRAAQAAALEAQAAEVARKLDRDRRVLQRESRALLQLPGRKERAEMEELRTELATLREEMKARDSRSKTNADRLRRRIDELASQNEALKEEVRRAEMARLAAEDAAAMAASTARRAARASASVAAEAVVSQPRSQQQSKPPVHATPSVDDIARAAGVPGVDYGVGMGGGRSSSAQAAHHRSHASAAAPAGPDEAEDAHTSMPAEIENHEEHDDDVLAGAVWAPRPREEDILISDAALGRCTGETLHPDGRRERVFAGGGRDVLFPNGTRKVAPPGSSSVVVTFANGDIKRSQRVGGASGVEDVTYYYAAVDTWHCTHGSTGVEVFHFPTGQVEAHAPDGRKDILFPDGSARRVHADGKEEDISGSTV